MLNESKHNIFDTPKQLTDHVSDLIIELANKSIAENGIFTIALSGGKTPKQLYQRLASKSRLINWRKTLIFFSDERYLPHDHRLSNYNMIKENLLDLAPIPYENVFPIDTSEDQIELAAQNYEQKITQHVTSTINSLPAFDLILLGVGEDGHTASLFPSEKHKFNSNRLVIPTMQQQTRSHRISFTFRLINNAKNIFILVTGKSKSNIINLIQKNQNRPNPKFPIEYVNALHNITWFLDKEAYKQ